jgi:hypothetical protein
MMRRIPGFKYAVVGLFGVALVSVACNDDEDAPPNGGAGNAGTSSGAGSGGKATAGTSSSGSTNGGTDGGTDAGGGTAGGAGAGGTAGSGTMGGAGADAGGAAGAAGAAGEGGEGGAMGGAGGAGGAGGEGGEGGPPFVADVLDNPGFEANLGTTITGWSNEGTPGASFVEYKDADAHSGHHKLSHWTAWTQGGANPDYTARTYQTVGPIANGTYSFSMWVNRDWENEQYLYARGFDANDANLEKKVDTIDTDGLGYVKVTLSGIQVTSGTVTVGIYTAAPAGSFANIDDAELVLE